MQALFERIVGERGKSSIPGRRMWAMCLLCVICGLGPARAEGGLRDPGLTETEIRNAWKMVEGELSSVEVKGSYPYLDCFRRSAEKHGLPLPLLIAVARGESNFDARALSTVECIGVMQIKWPITARHLGIHRKSDLYNPCLNIDAGARYLAWLLKRYDGDTYLAVAAYNRGPGRVSFTHVPQKGQWYAAYIQRHLRFVMESTYRKTDRLLLLEFTFYKNAAAFAAYLEENVPGIPLEVFKSRKYTYDIWLTYTSGMERDRYLRLLREKTAVQPQS